MAPACGCAPGQTPQPQASPTQPQVTLPYWQRAEAKSGRAPQKGVPPCVGIDGGQKKHFQVPCSQMQLCVG
jgi:hypothetical protein